jgi:hypothetical protein
MEECAQMCDSMGCDSMERAYCMSMYNDKGEYVGSCMSSCGKKCTSKEECMKNCGATCAAKHMWTDKACCANKDSKACAADPAKCEKKEKGGACCKDKH